MPDFELPYDLENPNADDGPSFEDLAGMSPRVVIAKNRQQVENAQKTVGGREQIVFSEGYLAGLDFCRKVLASTAWIHIPGGDVNDVEGLREMLEEANNATLRLEEIYEEAFGEPLDAEDMGAVADAYEEMLT